MITKFKEEKIIINIFKSIIKSHRFKSIENLSEWDFRRQFEEIALEEINKLSETKIRKLIRADASGFPVKTVDYYSIPKFFGDICLMNNSCKILDVNYIKGKWGGMEPVLTYNENFNVNTFCFTKKVLNKIIRLILPMIAANTGRNSLYSIDKCKYIIKNNSSVFYWHLMNTSRWRYSAIDIALADKKFRKKYIERFVYQRNPVRLLYQQGL